MITQMKKYTFMVFHRDYDAFLTAIREAGVVHIAEKGEGVAESEEMQAALAKVDQLRHIIRQGATDQLLSDKAEVEKQIADTEREIKRMSVWGPFDPQMVANLKNAGYGLGCYSCAEKHFQEEWGVVVAQQAGKVYFVQTGPDPVNLSAEPGVSAETLNEKSVAQLGDDLVALGGLLAAANARIEGWQKAEMPKLEAELKEAEAHVDWTRVQLHTNREADGALCIAEGFCPVDAEANLEAVLKQQEVYYTVEDPTEEDNTPIKLRNNKFTQLFECLTGMYGWPTYGEFDPTPILAPFYLLFFSMCMGDAGYGLLLIAFGLLTHYKKINIAMFDGLGPIITVLGVGTTVVGFFLGTFLGMSLYDAAWYPEALKSIIVHGNVAGFDAQMVLAIGIGVFHICLAMVVKAICYTKRYGFRANLGTWGWTLLIVGGIITIASAMLLNLPTEVTKWTLIAIGGVSAVGIYLLNTPGRNPLLNIGGGLWETYNMVTGLMGDVLSYVRLYALGLAGGMLGSAFNTLGNIILGGDPASARISWIFAIVVLLFGHLLNLAMSALGAFVHPLRLTFVEYFKNAGYEGKGEQYKPFKK